jgi:hypothetical protein
MSVENNVSTYINLNYFHIDAETVLRMVDTIDGGTINNVAVGTHPECFASQILEEQPIPTYNLLYINGENKLRGKALRLSINHSNRDLILAAYSFLLAEEFDKDPIAIYTTFQEQTRTMCEKLGFFTISENELSAYEGKNPTIIVKGSKGIIRLAWVNRLDVFKFIFGPLAKIVPVREVNYIYLMYNNRNYHFKIGKSWNPKHREKTLQAEAPEISMVAVWKASYKLERNLHNRYKHKRLRGEWFNLTFKELKDIKDYVDNFIAESTNR